jgi:hypothetical protein
MPLKKKRLTARTADPHHLYEASVQDTGADCRFIDRIYKKARGVLPERLREDFCGTAKLCAEWVRRGSTRQAIGLDLDQPTMDWGKAEHLEPLGEAAARVRLLRRDVLSGLGKKDRSMDVSVAFNFSYCAFKERATMLRYFKGVYRDTASSGAFFLDIHGGNESFDELEESVKHRGFTYVWDQGPYDPVTGSSHRAIHFRFPDGTQLRRAFTYDWRMWTLPELQDLLVDAGFAQVDVYWEGAADDGSGNGRFRKVQRAPHDPSFVAYLVAWRRPTP